MPPLDADDACIQSPATEADITCREELRGMDHGYGYDYVNGRKVPQLVVDGDYVLSRTHRGTVHVQSGHFLLQGILQGTLDIHPGVTATVTGTEQGSVRIYRDSNVVVAGAIEGSTTVERGATLVIEPGGKLAGALTNEGRVVIRGVFGGPRTGRGEFVLEGGGRIKQPTIRDGITYYEWRNGE